MIIIVYNQLENGIFYTCKESKTSSKLQTTSSLGRDSKNSRQEANSSSLNCFILTNISFMYFLYKKKQFNFSYCNDSSVWIEESLNESTKLSSVSHSMFSTVVFKLDVFFIVSFIFFLKFLI
jgi:hypothetical protein